MQYIVSIVELLPGMMLAQDLISPDGKIRLGEGSVLTTGWIARLQSWDIKQVAVFSDQQDYFSLEEMESLLQEATDLLGLISEAF